MIESLVKANLNLYAVLRNLPDLVDSDPVAARTVARWRIGIQFVVWRGPAATLAFEDGACIFERGRHGSPEVVLGFVSPGHLNRLMDGKGTPVPFKGFKQLGFMRHEFPKIADRLAFFLKPTDAKLADPHYLAVNTRLTLATAVFAARELALFDPLCRQVASRIRDGAVALKILPDGPAAHLVFAGGEVTAGLGDVQRPMARIDFRDLVTANGFLNGRLDPFTAIAGGELAIRGQTSMIDNLSLIFDRIPGYLG
ncbi:MAG: hypothetical protein V2L15_05010 [Desulfobacteraceae bacterium]|nr:hypothetical protein [Desulfobacteraceae bacterium]